MEALSDRLLRIRDRHHVKNHPFFDEWAEGRLSMRQMGGYMLQHYLHVVDIFRAMGVLYSKAPEEAGRFVIENLAEEHGLLGMQDRDATDHFEIIKRFIRAAGYSDADLAPENRYLWNWARIHSFWDVVNRYPWQVFMAMLACLESQEVGLNGRLVPAFYQHYGYKPSDPVIRFFEEHYVADVEHGSRSLGLVDTFATDETVIAQCLQMAELGCRYKWEYMNEIHQKLVLDARQPVAG